MKLENTNLSAILDSKNFKIRKFEKRGREMAHWNGTSHGLRPFPEGPGNLTKLQGHNRLRSVDFLIDTFLHGINSGGFS